MEPQDTALIDKVLKRDLVNIQRRVAAGEVISNAEREVLLRAKAESSAATVAEQQISGPELCKLTGLTDRRHRQLAKAGYFPPPSKSFYQLAPTIKGLFTYYRDGNRNSSDTFLSERIRETQHRANLLEIEEKEKRRQLVPIEDVGRAWDSVVIALRQAIWNFDAQEADRRRWLAELRDLKPDDYLRKEEAEPDEDAS